MTEQSYWRLCSSCKTQLPFSAPYWVCSVSTCNRKRTGLSFCSVSCWEVHLPMMRHREAYAVEQRAPTREQWEREEAEAEAEAEADTPAASPPAPRASATSEPPRRRTVASGEPDLDDDVPLDVLVVVSKLKKYIKARSGMNCSDNVVPVLSRYVRQLCDEAIREAGRDGRRTVMDRDFKR